MFGYSWAFVFSGFRKVYLENCSPSFQPSSVGAHPKYKMDAMSGEDPTHVVNSCGMPVMMVSRPKVAQGPSHVEKIGNGMSEDHQLHVYQVGLAR